MIAFISLITFGTLFEIKMCAEMIMLLFNMIGPVDVELGDPRWVR